MIMLFRNFMVGTFENFAKPAHKANYYRSQQYSSLKIKTSTEEYTTRAQRLKISRSRRSTDAMKATITSKSSIMNKSKRLHEIYIAEKSREKVSGEVDSLLTIHPIYK